jgi:hypothetical protein
MLTSRFAVAAAACFLMVTANARPIDWPMESQTELPPPTATAAVPPDWLDVPKPAGAVRATRAAILFRPVARDMQAPRPAARRVRWTAAAPTPQFEWSWLVNTPASFTRPTPTNPARDQGTHDIRLLHFHLAQDPLGSLLESARAWRGPRTAVANPRPETYAPVPLLLAGHFETR